MQCCSGRGECSGVQDTYEGRSLLKKLMLDAYNSLGHIQLAEMQRPAAGPTVEEFDLKGAIEAAAFGTAEFQPGIEIHHDTRKKDYAFSNLFLSGPCKRSIHWLEV
jgi:hypothetical protein